MSGAVEITRTLTFEAAHRLPKSVKSPECERLHGHSYKLEATWRREDHVFDDEGMLLNFRVLADMLEEVKQLFDHQFINTVPLPPVAACPWTHFDSHNGNPPSTAECVGTWLAHYLTALTTQHAPDAGLRLFKLTLRETEKCSVTIYL